MGQEELMQFVQWLPSKIKEFQNKTPEEIVGKLNELAQTEDGMNTISGLINQFKQEQSAGMFKQGGKLAYLVNKFKDGGSTNEENLQRKSDKARKEFHGVDLFEYGPNKWVHNGAQVARSLKPGVNQTVLPNGVGLRQITRNNITTSELVSPNKQDTLYIHNGIGGRVDSNIDDSGILGFLGLRRSSPVSNRYKELQSKFGAQKFAEGKIIPKIKRDTVVNNVGNLTDRGVIDREMIIAGTIPGTNNQLIDSIRRHVIAPTFENPYLGTQTMPGDTLYYRTSGVYTPSGNALQRVQDNNYKPTKEEKEKLNKK